MKYFEKTFKICNISYTICYYQNSDTPTIAETTDTLVVSEGSVYIEIGNQIKLILTHRIYTEKICSLQIAELIPKIRI